MPEAKSVWLKPSDDDEWVPCSTSYGGAGKTKLTRMYGPQGTPKELTLPDAEVAKLRPVQSLEVRDDLVFLNDPHESSMLHNLRMRYAEDKIYTAIGPVCLAINPYKKVASVDADDAPHCNRTARAAYAGLLEGTPQSILISGESGAGKTETNKLCMNCLAEVSNSAGVATTAQSLQAAVLLESFGNARTVHNHNSSRFGKWCAVHFDGTGKMAATQIQSYLLEKSRVVGPSAGERNYHVFYQLVKGSDADERARLGLLPSVSDYHYLRHGEADAPGIDDKVEWAATKAMLAALGFTAESQTQMFRLYAGVLALGNISFAPTGKPDTFKVKDARALDAACALLQVPAPMLAAKLTSRVMTTASSSYTVPLKEEQCVDTRDALAKAIYAGLFEQLIGRLNATLGARQIPAADQRYIGLLDIFGFENFAVNGFEQLCINFTNEKLQQHFMDALIKREQQEYAREGVSFTHITFPDNSPQIELIDHKRQGVFAMLDEECNVPKGSEANYVAKMHVALGGNAHYSKPQFGSARIGKDLGEAKSKTQFVLCHYADRVQYTAYDWLEKNRGTLHPDLATLMTTSDAPGLQLIFEATPEELAAGKKQTVGAAFRASLRALSATMLQTTQHFIRCIKPNGDKKPDAFNGAFVCRQLRYTGVHSVVDIHRAGYPIKFAFADFVKRYRCIAFDKPHLIADKVADTQRCVNLLRVAQELARAETRPAERKTGDDWLKEMRVQMGKTRVFMRGDVLTHLDRPRAAARARAAVCLQRFARHRLARRIAHLAVRHRALHGAAREALDGDAERGTTGRDAATLERRLGGAGAILDVLQAAWAAFKLPLAVDGTGELAALHAQLGALEEELRALQAGLRRERQALDELRAVVAATAGGTTKEAFIALRTAVHAAAEASIGLTEDLEAAVAGVEVDLNERFAALVSDANAELQAILAAREVERRERCAEAEAELWRAGYDAAEDLWEIREVALRNGKDAKGKPLLGYTLERMVAGGAPGAKFDAMNAVSLLVKDGAAARDAALRVGDVLLKVNGERLHGERAAERLDATPAGAYKLTIARRRVGADVASLPKGERHGWMYVAREAKGESSPPTKLWAVLQGEHLVFYEEDARGQERVPRPQPLKGCVVKVPMGKALKVNRVQQFDTQHQRLVKRDKRELKKGEFEVRRRSKMVDGLGVSTQVAQSPAVAAYLHRQLAPFRLLWADDAAAAELVCAVADDDERAGWVAALRAKAEAISANAPTCGWLEKRKGRTWAPDGLSKVLGFDKRWFVLTPASAAGEDARLEYFERQGAPVAKGCIPLNKQSVLLVSEQLKSDNPFGFCISSQGKDDARPLTTVLAAPKGSELDKWSAAIRRAINGGGATSKAERAAEAKRSKEEEALRKKPAAQLRQLLDYMGATEHAGVTDVDVLAQLVMQRRAAAAGAAGDARAAAGVTRDKVREQMAALEAQLRKRSVEELRALLEYMELAFDPALEDHEQLVALAVRHKNVPAVAQSVAPQLLKWAQRSSSRLLARQEAAAVERA